MALPLFLKIDVTNDDIANAYFAKRNGKRAWASSCPISTAIRRQLGAEATTSFDSVRIDGEFYESSRAVKDYIKTVDAVIDSGTAGIEPQTFYLKHA